MSILVGVAPWREHMVNGPTLLRGPTTYWIVAITDDDPNPLAAKDKNTYDPIVQADIRRSRFSMAARETFPNWSSRITRIRTYLGPSFSIAENFNSVPEPSMFLLSALVWWDCFSGSEDASLCLHPVPSIDIVGGSCRFPRASRLSSRRLVYQSTGPKSRLAAAARIPNSCSISLRSSRICEATAAVRAFSRCSIAHRTPA